MSAFLEEIRKTTELNKFKRTESVTKDLIIKIQKAAEEGYNQIKISPHNDEERKIIDNFCKAHSFYYYFCGSVVTITW